MNQVARCKGPLTPRVSISVNAAMVLAILFSLKIMESLENGLQLLFWSDSSIIFNENRIASIITELSLKFSVNGH